MLEDAAVDRITLKCNHTTVFGDLYHITHTNTVKRFETSKSDPVTDVVKNN